MSRLTLHRVTCRNGKAAIAEDANSAANDRLTSVAWVTNAPLRINVRRQVTDSTHRNVPWGLILILDLQVDVESSYRVSHTTGPNSDGDSMHGDVKNARDGCSSSRTARTLKR